MKKVEDIPVGAFTGRNEDTMQRTMEKSLGIERKRCRDDRGEYK